MHSVSVREIKPGSSCLPPLIPRKRGRPKMIRALKREKHRKRRLDVRTHGVDKKVIINVTVRQLTIIHAELVVM
jgi:hypothetical protein